MAKSYLMAGNQLYEYVSTTIDSSQYWGVEAHLLYLACERLFKSVIELGNFDNKVKLLNSHDLSELANAAYYMSVTFTDTAYERFKAYSACAYELRYMEDTYMDIKHESLCELYNLTGAVYNTINQYHRDRESYINANNNIIQDFVNNTVLEICYSLGINDQRRIAMLQENIPDAMSGCVDLNKNDPEQVRSFIEQAVRMCSGM